eukprot:TRINITY_DN6165_c0_g1_i2.p1 TRINITY_DN6165_c0_g1~~TRINITY_DN6165_c0_g1_i2.p1  ORF type:complete len:478 (+),score=37.77 TRINITY_DN6165_c0_g1_i2:58-1434(+)
MCIRDRDYTRPEAEKEMSSILALQRFAVVIDDNRGCLSRWFGKMEPQSVRASMLALAVTAIGGGVLSLPFVCKLCGLVFGIILLILGYATSMWSFSMIIGVTERIGTTRSFKEFCLKTGGNKLMLFYNMTVIFTIYGTLIGYQVIISTLIQRILKSFEVPNSEDYKVLHTVILSCVVIFPVCLLKSVNNLRYATILSLTSITYTCVVLIVELPMYWSNSKTERKITLFNLDWGFFDAFGITFFAFMSQTGFFAATEKLEKRDSSHLNAITVRAVTINLAFYFLITCAGFLSTLDDTKGLIIDRAPPFEGKDYAMIIAQILITCSLTIGVPLNYVPVRSAVFEQIFTHHEYTFPRGLISALIFASTTCFFTVYIPGIQTVLSIVGGFGCVAISYIVPLIGYLSVFRDQPKRCYVYILISSTLVAIGFGAAINAILELVWKQLSSKSSSSSNKNLSLIHI